MHNDALKYFRDKVEDATDPYGSLCYWFSNTEHHWMVECIHGDVWACLGMEDSFVILVLGGGVPECAEQIIVVC